jgi:peptidoglycan/xylan/chitin deacetylase (PgdA/CDA1 family)
MNSIPVLMYHHVNPHDEDRFTVTPEVFEGQMAHLVKAGYKALSLDELYSFIKGELILKQKAIVITFDDGWLDNYIYAFPVLKKYKLRATFFLITDWIEKASENFDGIPPSIPNHEESKVLVDNGEKNNVILSWGLIKEMADSGLIDFFSHSASHKISIDLSESDIHQELEESKRILEQRIGGHCHYYCWPHGEYNKLSLSIARKTGYKALFTSERGVVQVGSDPFLIKRIPGELDVSSFKNCMWIFTNPILAALYLGMKKMGLRTMIKRVFSERLKSRSASFVRSLLCRF